MWTTDFSKVDSWLEKAALSKIFLYSKVNRFQVRSVLSRRSPIGLQVPAELAIANDPVLLQINGRRIVAVPNRRQVPSGRMATAMIVPVRRAAKDVVQVPFAHHAKAVQHLVFERLHHPLHVRLQVR